MSILAIESGQHNRVEPVRTALPNFEFALSVFSYKHSSIVNLHQMGKGGQLGKGVPIKFDELESIVDAVREKETGSSRTTEILPDNILINEKKTLVWFTPAQKRPMWFTGRKKGLMVWYPALLWACKSRSVRIAALNSNRRPNMNTLVYRAPLMNISKSGAFCLGGATLPRVIEPQSIGEIEDCLFDARFSHLNNTYDNEPEYMRTDEAHIKYWVEREKANKKWSVKDGTRLGRLREWLSQAGIE